MSSGQAYLIKSSNLAYLSLEILDIIYGQSFYI